MYICEHAAAAPLLMHEKPISVVLFNPNIFFVEFLFCSFMCCVYGLFFHHRQTESELCMSRGRSFMPLVSSTAPTISARARQITKIEKFMHVPALELFNIMLAADPRLHRSLILRNIFYTYAR
jgi:hypothetical protein